MGYTLAHWAQKWAARTGMFTLAVGLSLASASSAFATAPAPGPAASSGQQSASTPSAQPNPAQPPAQQRLSSQALSAKDSPSTASATDQAKPQLPPTASTTEPGSGQTQQAPSQSQTPSQAQTRGTEQKIQSTGAQSSLSQLSGTSQSRPGPTGQGQSPQPVSRSSSNQLTGRGVNDPQISPRGIAVKPPCTLGSTPIKSCLPDPAFAQAIATLGNKSVNDPLTHSDADTTFLWLSGNGIESINGIQNFAYLDTLNISDNHVTDLSPLKGLPQDKVWPWMNKFIELNISNNGITDPAALNLDSLTNLTDLATLNMSGNKMGNITALQAVTVFPSLTSLDLSSNQISDMTPITQRLSQLTKLSTLDISKQIIRLPDLTLNPGQPMSLGPGTVNSGNPPATPALLAAQDPAKPLAPATNGSYDAPGAKAVWSTTLPGEHTYSFAHSGALTVAGKSYAFSGTFIQDVTGSIVTFDPANGQPTFTRPVAANTAVARPPDPVRADWHFAGWFQAGASSPWNFSQPVLTSMTLTARWSQFRTLPQSGAIPLEHLGGGALLMVSLVSAGAYGAYLLVRKRPLSAPSSRLAGRRSSQRRH